MPRVRSMTTLDSAIASCSAFSSPSAAVVGF